MKRKLIFLSQCAAFLLILCVILTVLSAVFPPQATVGNPVDEPMNSLDYVVIGDSEGTTSVSPLELWKEYGFAGYNCGVPAQEMQYTYYNFEKVLRRQSPKIVLLETNVFFKGITQIHAVQEAAEYLAEKIFPIYEYHDEWKTMFFPSVKNPAKSEGEIMLGWRYKTPAVAYVGGDYVKKTERITAIGRIQKDYLDKVVRLCRKKNIQLILYSAPSPLCWDYSKHNAIAQYAEKNDLTYVDLNLEIDKVGIDWKRDTFDKGDHLNWSGAKKVSLYLGEYLARTTSLPDRRTDAAYSEWNERLKQYTEYIESTRSSPKK